MKQWFSGDLEVQLLVKLSSFHIEVVLQLHILTEEG